MASGVTLSGWLRFATLLEGLGTAMEEEDGTWWVVVGADYGLAVHDGTRRMPGRPYLQRAVFQVARQFKPKGARAVSVGNRTSGRATWAIMVGNEKLAKQVAFAVEGVAKREAPVDTGNLRATIVAAPTIAAALDEAFRRAVDRETVIAA